MNIEKIIDAYNFKTHTEDAHGQLQPEITTGSIILGVLLRSFFIIILAFFLKENFWWEKFWYVTLFVLWFFVAWPAIKQYQIFNEETEDFSESTMCGSCRNFDKTSRLCRKYDQHPTLDFLPCDGNDWEPTTFEDKF